MPFNHCNLLKIFDCEMINYMYTVHTGVCVCMYIYIYMCVCVCICMYIYICMDMCIYMYMCVYMYVYMCVYVYNIYICTYMCVCICIYAMYDAGSLPNHLSPVLFLQCWPMICHLNYGTRSWYIMQLSPLLQSIGYSSGCLYFQFPYPIRFLSRPVPYTRPCVPDNHLV